MNDSRASSCELQARFDWSIGLIAELVCSARDAGWLPGEQMTSADVDVLFARVSASSAESALNQICARLGLTTSEQNLLWLLACVELDPHVAAAAHVLVPSGMTDLSAQIVERVIGRGETLADDVFERLKRFALIDCNMDLPMNRRPVRVHPRVVDAARGRYRLDADLATAVSLDDALTVRRSSSEEVQVPVEMRAMLARSERMLFVVTGAEGTGRATVSRQAISAAGRGVLSVDSRSLADDDERLDRQLRAIARECMIHDAWPLFLEMDSLATRFKIFERTFLREVSAPVLGTATESRSWPTQRPVISVPLLVPDTSARQRIWRKSLPTVRDVVLTECAQRYSVPPAVIVSTAAAASRLAGDESSVDVTHVHRALRMHLERKLIGTAHRIETQQTWNDLVLPIDQFDLLIEMVARVRHKRRVLDEWGFGDKVGRGLGMSALISGPPGTGKTMIAGLIARELGLDLYQVDLSKVVSKYIGETEKQLASLFDAAESGHAILLFDEADSLFAKRTDVKSSNDRYANLEVNYLLQRIEAFSGIAIMTTNYETAIDQAFLRRLAFHIRVPMPDEKQREMIWKAMLPEKADRAGDLDFSELAQSFEMSGGYIKNAVLRAAFLSAERGHGIAKEHLWRAARAEYEAIGKISFQPSRRASPT